MGRIGPHKDALGFVMGLGQVADGFLHHHAVIMMHQIIAAAYHLQGVGFPGQHTNLTPDAALAAAHGGRGDVLGDAFGKAVALVQAVKVHAAAQNRLVPGVGQKMQEGGGALPAGCRCW